MSAADQRSYGLRRAEAMCRSQRISMINSSAKPVAGTSSVILQFLKRG